MYYLVIKINDSVDTAEDRVKILQQQGWQDVSVLTALDLDKFNNKVKREAMLEHLEELDREVEKWPQWKKDAAKAALDVNLSSYYDE